MLTREEQMEIFGLYMNGYCYGKQVRFPDEPDRKFHINAQNIGSLYWTSKLLLTPLSAITDEHAVEVAKMAWQVGDIKWMVDKRNNRGIWMSGEDHLGIKYYFQMNEYGAIHTNTIYPDKTLTHSIGHIGLSVRDGIPYINIVDKLRSWGYMLPYNGVDLFEAGIAIVKQ